MSDETSGSRRIEILIVEDSPTQAEQLQHILEQKGYVTRTTHDGLEALTEIRVKKPTIVISDIVMPRMDGYQLCRQIKDDSALRDLPVILLTGLSDLHDVIRGLECGADNFITKPYNEHYLLSRIEFSLANARLQSIERAQFGVEIYFAGRKHFITSDRLQILTLLLSTYETAVQKSQELIQVQEALRRLNEDLERKVEERTAALTGEIAERERAEKALQEMNQTLQALIQAAPLAIVATDAEGVITRWNPAAELLFGWTAGEALGKSNPMTPKDRESEYLDLRKQVLGGEWFSNMELSLMKKDGGPVEVSLSAAPLRDANHRIAGIMAIIADITERKGLESQLIQAQKMEAVGQLAGGVAHDFNNLLTIIMGYATLLSSKVDLNSPAHKDLQEIQQAGERATKLTRQLLVFSRRQVIQPQVLDLNAVIKDMNRMLLRLIGEDIQFLIELDPALGPIMADPGHIEQVVMNLVVNARDAMPTGGKLSIETANVALDEAYANVHRDVRPGLYVELLVSDTGSGMDEATQNRIFEPFFTTKEPGKGTGLGLSTVYGIVKQSAGHIEVVSRPNQGATFKIYLPRSEATPTTVAKNIQPSKQAGGSETVLLVEDEPAVRLLTRQLLQILGYTVLEAANGDEALLLVQEYTGGMISLVLTDVVMPQMSGQELQERLVASHPAIKVLYMSGYTDRALERHGILDANIPLLQKPFRLETLARKVREVLDMS